MSDSLAQLGHAQAALEQAERELGAAVGAARAQGATWQQVADVLGVSRQAAFKRFSRASDPVTGEQLVPAPMADVAGLAHQVFTRLAAGDAQWARERMTQACARVLTRDAIQQVWREVLAENGELEHLEASSHDVHGDELPGNTVPLPAVGRLELAHEAGDLWAHVLVNRDGRISGMVIRPGEVPETWPL